jgi:hypothetical protein
MVIGCDLPDGEALLQGLGYLRILQWFEWHVPITIVGRCISQCEVERLRGRNSVFMPVYWHELGENVTAENMRLRYKHAQIKITYSWITHAFFVWSV